MLSIGLLLNPTKKVQEPLYKADKTQIKSCPAKDSLKSSGEGL